MDAFLHRARGEILLKRDTANTVPAEEAFLTAIAVAQQQKARSFELRAAMSLARLWRSQGKVAASAANCWLRCTGGSRKVSTRAI
jgi:predicted ATPase